MQPYFNDKIGTYYSNRAIEVAYAAMYLGTDRMNECDNRLSYGQSISGHFLINVRKHDRDNTVTIMLTDDHMELYHADSHGRVKTNIPHHIITYGICNNIAIDTIRGNIWEKIEGMLRSALCTTTVNCMSNPIYNYLWCAYYNTDIEQVRDCFNYIGIDNMGYGQAFYGYNDAGNLIVWLKRNPSINIFTIPQRYRQRSIIVECVGGGKVNIYNSNRFGMPHNDNYCEFNGDDNNDHTAFIEKVKNECGVYLV